MKMLSQLLFYTKLGFIRWHKNPKVILVFIATSCLLVSYLSPIQDSITKAHLEIASIYLYPFLLTQKFLAATLFFGLLIINTNTPLDCPSYNFAVLRTGKTKMILGHIFYIFGSSFLYFLFVLLFTTCFFITRICFQTDWGNALYMLGFTNLAVDQNVSVGIYRTILLGYTALSALVHSFLLSFLSGVIIGLIQFALRLVGLNKLSLISFLLVCPVFWSPALPRSLFRFAPSLWVNLNIVNKINMNVPSIGSLYLEAVILIVSLINICCLIKKRGG